MLNNADCCNQLAAGQWLHQHGAQRPAALCNMYARRWHSAMLALARAEGCNAPTHSFMSWCDFVSHIQAGIRDTDSDSDNGSSSESEHSGNGSTKKDTTGELASTHV
jgi:hypothetical protein